MNKTFSVCAGIDSFGGVSAWLTVHFSHFFHDILFIHNARIQSQIWYSELLLIFDAKTLFIVELLYHRASTIFHSNHFFFLGGLYFIQQKYCEFIIFFVLSSASTIAFQFHFALTFAPPAYDLKDVSCSQVAKHHSNKVTRQNSEEITHIFCVASAPSFASKRKKEAKYILLML